MVTFMEVVKHHTGRYPVKTISSYGHFYGSR